MEVLIIPLVIIVITSTAIVLTNRMMKINSEREKIALLFVSAIVLQKPISENQLISYTDKIKLNETMGFIFDPSKIYSFENIKNGDVGYLPYHFKSCYVIKFKKMEIINFNYFPDYNKIISFDKNEITIPVNHETNQ